MPDLSGIKAPPTEAYSGICAIVEADGPGLVAGELIINCWDANELVFYERAVNPDEVKYFITIESNGKFHDGKLVGLLW